MSGIGLRSPYTIRPIQRSSPYVYSPMGQQLDLSSIGNMPATDYGFSTGNSGLGLNYNSDGFGFSSKDLANIGNNGNNSGNWLTNNMGGIKLGLDAIGAIGGLYNAFQANKLAKQQFNFIKDITNTNLNNQIKSYNTSMEGRARVRAQMEGHGDNYVDDYMDRNRMTRG